jgi:hypothetical protein
MGRLQGPICTNAYASRRAGATVVWLDWPAMKPRCNMSPELLSLGACAQTNRARRTAEGRRQEGLDAWGAVRAQETSSRQRVDLLDAPFRV